MKNTIRDFQKKILKEFSKEPMGFALSGGTALDLFYLHSRFSRDLDFFSSEFYSKNIENLIRRFSRIIKAKFELESEYSTEHRAKVRFYTAKPKRNLTIKVDFIEDVFFDKPKIRKFNNIPVYDVEIIYHQKIIAIAGTHLIRNGFGKEISAGRFQARDIYDLYCLSQKIMPLHKFLKKVKKEQQRGIVQWYRNFSRKDLKLELLDLDIYDKDFDATKLIKHIDDEIKLFIKGVTHGY